MCTPSLSNYSHLPSYKRDDRMSIITPPHVFHVESGQPFTVSIFWANIVGNKRDRNILKVSMCGGHWWPLHFYVNDRPIRECLVKSVKMYGTLSEFSIGISKYLSMNIDRTREFRWNKLVQENYFQLKLLVVSSDLEKYCCV